MLGKIVGVGIYQSKSNTGVIDRAFSSALYLQQEGRLKIHIGQLLMWSLLRYSEGGATLD